MIQLGWAGIGKYSKQYGHNDIAHYHTNQRRGYQSDNNLAYTSKIQTCHTHIGHEHTANHTAYKGMRGRARQANFPCKQIPNNGTHQRSNNNRFLNGSYYNISTNGLGYTGTNHSTQEVQHRRHNNSFARRYGSSGYRSGNSIGCIVEAVDKVEYQGQQHYNNYKRMNIKHTSLPHLLTNLPFFRSDPEYPLIPPKGPSTLSAQ